MYIKPFFIGCNCSGGHIYPQSSIVIDSVYFNDDDWWLAEKCKSCGIVTVVGSPNLYLNSKTIDIEGKTYSVVEPRFI